MRPGGTPDNGPQGRGTAGGGGGAPVAEAARQVRGRTEAETSSGGPLSESRPPIPDRVGPFQVLGLLGEGGMGAVYLAQQTEPLRRQVAVKLLRSPLAGRAAVYRFEAEGQALARMTHPNVAQVYEAGATGDGTPYIAMEHVPGEPITDYCDHHRLDPRQRLELLVGVCHGLHHAHQKGVVHRDVKPSNILVTEGSGGPLAKVVDFGVAKALDEPLTDASLRDARDRLVDLYEAWGRDREADRYRAR